MNPQYRMFVDESGDDYMKHFTNPNSEHLCLNSVIINLKNCQDIETDINALKVTYFNIDTVNANYPLHRREIIDCSPPFDTLLDEDIRIKYNSEFLNFLKEWDITTITVLIDKAKLKNKYTNPYNPYRFGFALLMERYVIFLKSKNAVGDIMAESINAKRDKRLKNVYAHLYSNDLPELNFDHREFQQYFSSRQLKIKKKSECICGLEIADLLVSALKRKIYKRNYPEKFTNSSFDTEILAAIDGKILRKGGRENGIGLKVFP